MTFFRTVLQLVECPSACPGEGNAICAEQSITPDWIHLENGYFVDSIISSSSNRDAYSTLECLYVIPIVILFYFILSHFLLLEREKKRNNRNSLFTEIRFENSYPRRRIKKNRKEEEYSRI